VLLLGAEDLSWRGTIKGKEGDADKILGCGDLDDEDDDNGDVEGDKDEATDRDTSFFL